MNSATLEKAKEVLKLVKENFPRAKLLLWDADNAETGYHDFEDFDLEDGQKRVILLGIDLNQKVSLACEFKSIVGEDEEDDSEYPSLTVSDV
jgi:hypothetical protein